MLFHSYEFLIFLALFLLGFRFCRGEARIIYTCVASYVFYAWWYPPYLVLLLGLTVYAHLLAGREGRSRLAFAGVIVLGLLPLAVFKYSGFIAANLESVVGDVATFKPDWRLPLGISFVTFTVVSYLADVRRGHIARQPKFWTTALYVSFFPHLVAGPILRAHELMPQLTSMRIRLESVKPALLLFAVGVLKKTVFADQIGPAVDAIYASQAPLTSAEAVLAFYGFAVQIYCDFSGYTDMALALALLLGVTLPQNFERPYLAGSVREFWRRWHMTLSRWLRDYLYVSLGGNRQGFGRMLFAIMATMLLGGLWHGAAWTFVAWGALHGTGIVVEHLSRRAGIDVERVPLWLRRAVIVHFVCVGWIFFRAPTFEGAQAMIGGFLAGGDAAILGSYPLVPVLVGLGFALHPFDRHGNLRAAAERLPGSVIVPLSVIMIAAGALLSAHSPAAFIYFDF